jgi:hypothetical protein
MFTYRSGEVYGTKVLYAAMVIGSVVLLLAMIANPNAGAPTIAKAPVEQTTVAANPSSAS